MYSELQFSSKLYFLYVHEHVKNTKNAFFIGLPSTLLFKMSFQVNIPDFSMCCGYGENSFGCAVFRTGCKTVFHQH